MKVLLVTGSFPPMRCGVGDYSAHLASALVNHSGADVLVFTSRSDAPTASGAGVEVVRAMVTWHRDAIGEFRAAVRHFAPHVVHIQFPTQGYDRVDGLVAMATHCRFVRHIPVVATLHEYLPASFSVASRHIYQLALVANAIVVVRPGYREHIPALMRLLLPARKFKFVTNASAVPRVLLGAPERAAVRRELGCGDARLVAFFGFMYEHKGVDLLFQIADPARHHLLLIGALAADDAYHARLRALAESEPWRGKVTLTGFVDSDAAARLMAAADAVVFPYREGGGIWNSSLHAALSQDSFVLTTSQERNGYDEGTNVYYARPEDVQEMRTALLRYQDRRLARPAEGDDAWREIAWRHLEIYRAAAGRRLAA